MPPLPASSPGPSGPDSPRRLIVFAVGLVTAVAIGLWLLVRLQQIVLLVYVSGLLATGLMPLVRWMERRTGWLLRRARAPRWLGVLLVYLAALVLLAALVATVLPPLVKQTREFVQRAPGLLGQLQTALIERGILSEPVGWGDLLSHVPVGGAQAAGTVVSTVIGLLGGLVGLLTMVILTAYFLLGADQMLEGLVRLLPRSQQERGRQVAGQIAERVSAWLGGQLLLAGIIGGTTALGLGLMGVPYFFVLALIAAVGEVIPVVGPILAALPAVGVALGDSFQLALATAVFFVVQQQVENHLLVPRVMGQQVGLGPVSVILALLAGTTLLGILGALLAVPTAAIIQVLVQALWPHLAAPPPAGRSPRGRRPPTAA